MDDAKRKLVMCNKLRNSWQLDFDTLFRIQPTLDTRLLMTYRYSTTNLNY